MLEHINNKLILVVDNADNKEKIIEDLVDLIANNNDFITDKEEFLDKIYKREEVGTTGIGKAVAIPHARCESLKGIVLALCLVKNGIEFNTPDGEKAKIILVVGAPKENNSEYLKLLSKISKAFRDKEFRENIITAKDKDEIIYELAKLGA